MILLHPHKTISKIKMVNYMKIKLMIKRKALIMGEMRMMGFIKDQGSRTKPPHPRVHQTVQRDHPVNNILGDIQKENPSR
jgi:hypothetical protein